MVAQLNAAGIPVEVDAEQYPNGRFARLSMVMEGATVDVERGKIRHRITWTPKDGGSVRRHWEAQHANGDWSTAFDGTYTKR